MSSTQAPSDQGSPSSSSSLQIRLARVEESSSSASSSVAALQIPVQIPLQITHLGEQSQTLKEPTLWPQEEPVDHPVSFFPVGVPASDSSAAASDGETITLNSGALQTFEILPVSSPHKRYRSVEEATSGGSLK